ncbi:photosystem II stabilization [Halomonadaceae bacterium LMG 33818]|uniref:ComEA family DNA-binding protein n=1 Tax=Cernens ardua TaxID=3402176 RepID=UPI003EDC02DC
MLDVPSMCPWWRVSAHHWQQKCNQRLHKGIIVLLLALIPFHIEGAQAKATELSPLATEPPYIGQTLISVNSASLEELMRLPGIGRTRAHAIIDERNQHGPFIDSSDLERVKGIGRATAEKLKGKISFNR